MHQINPFVVIVIIAFIASFNTSVHFLGKDGNKYPGWIITPRIWWLIVFGTFFTLTFIVLLPFETSQIIDFSQISWHLFWKRYLPIISIFGMIYQAIYTVETEGMNENFKRPENKWPFISFYIYGVTFVIYAVIWVTCSLRTIF